jgi:hypothetical protein
LLSQEIRGTFVWLRKHVSDHSAVSYLHQIVLLLLDRKSKNSDSADSPQQQQLALLHEVGAENMKLLTSFAGHESLWYQRRLFSVTLLSSLFQMTNFQSPPSLSSDGSLWSDDLSLLTTATTEFLETIRQYFNEDCTLQVTPSPSQSDDEYNVEVSIAQQKNFFEEQIRPAPIARPASLPHPQSVVHQMVSLTIQWLTHEMRFVLDLLSDDMSYSPLLQQKYALRYIFFLTYLVRSLLPSSIYLSLI